MHHPTIAILGAGQLGRMLALAALPMGVRCRFLDPATASPEGCPAADVGEVIAADFSDRAALDRLADGADTVTYEFENVPADAVEYLAQRCRVSPPPLALRTAQDRLLEKQAFAACGIPTNRTAPWDPVPGSKATAHGDLRAAIESVGLPAVLKTRRLGYDGKGQRLLRALDYPQFLKETAAGDLPSAPLLVEAFVPFTRELSIIAVRSRAGEVRAYPLVQNTHSHGILRTTIAPAPDVTPQLQAEAHRHISTLMARLDYVGVMALELFEINTPAGPALLANEIAPRVHNTGHWTIEGAATSQFQNHIRAVLGLPLGDTSALGHSLMINLIGADPDPDPILAIPGASYHWYGKSVRPGRKVGHITLRADSPDQLNHHAALAAAALGPPPP